MKSIIDDTTLTIGPGEEILVIRSPDKRQETICCICGKKDCSGRHFKGTFYCTNCFYKTWERKECEHPYSKKLYLKCPFCGFVMKEKFPKRCTKCKVIIEEPSYCPFCEDGYNFYKKRKVK